MTPVELRAAQEALCARYKASFSECDLGWKAGVAANVTPDARVVNGLRIRPDVGTCGWFIWAGESFSEADDFFQPLHVQHLLLRCPSVVRFLALPAGWRFLSAGASEDVWADPKLLQRTM